MVVLILGYPLESTNSEFSAFFIEKLTVFEYFSAVQK